MAKKLFTKLKESLLTVVPLSLIVLILHFTIAPLPKESLIAFLLSALLLILGMSLFTLGADTAMIPIGESIGAKLTETRKPLFILSIAFLLGVIITIAEPDLQVLAQQVVGIKNSYIILSVSLGVGLFLVLALIRMALNIPLHYGFLFLYLLVFLFGAFVPEDFVALAFDSGGVTTGPITVPFIMALGIGLSAVLGGDKSHENSFGFIAFCSVGPILAIMIMGVFVPIEGTGEELAAANPQNFLDILQAYGITGFSFTKEIALALCPITVFFFIFQSIFLRLPLLELVRIGVGLLYTFLGLVLFLTAVSVGFMPIGAYLGNAIVSLPYREILIPLGLVLGAVLVLAEPAIQILNKQVEEITGGSISKKAMMFSISIGVGLALGLAMVRMLYHINIWYFLIIGYGTALLLTFFTPKIFTAIAFDSGGVASGPMTATFLLPFAMGVCKGNGGNIFTDAFGIVAMVAMTPLITIQLLGILFKIKERKAEQEERLAMAAILEEEEEIEFNLGDDEEETSPLPVEDNHRDPENTEEQTDKFPITKEEKGSETT